MKIEEKYQVLQRLETAKASGTTLISLLISGGKDINTVQKMLSKEKSLAGNIKCKKTRSLVVSALGQLAQTLRGLKINQSPLTGVALYSGQALAESQNCIVLQPQTGTTISRSLYSCGKTFVLGEMLDLCRPKRKSEGSVFQYGVVLVSGKGAKCFLHTPSNGATGTGRVALGHLEQLSGARTKQQKKQKKGGQSAQRIGRIRLERRSAWIKQVLEQMDSAFLTKDGTPSISGIVLAGPSTIKNELIAACFDHKAGEGSAGDTSGLKVSSGCKSILFRNISPKALHVLTTAESDDEHSAAALAHVQQQLPSLFRQCARRREESKWVLFERAMENNCALFGVADVRSGLVSKEVSEVLLLAEDYDHDLERWDKLCTSAGAQLSLFATPHASDRLRDFGGCVAFKWFAADDSGHAYVCDDECKDDEIRD